MEPLQCDICGGKLTMDISGEFAVCESCGMRHSKNRVQQKVQEIKGTVKVEGIANVDNLLLRAEQFFEQGDRDSLLKAYTYCEQILDLSPGLEKVLELQKRIDVKDFVLLIKSNKGFYSSPLDTRYDLNEKGSFWKLKQADPNNILLPQYLDELINSWRNDSDTNPCLHKEILDRNLQAYTCSFLDINDYNRADILFARIKSFLFLERWFSHYEYLKQKAAKLKDIMINKDAALDQSLRTNNYKFAELMLIIGANPNMSFCNKKYSLYDMTEPPVNYKTAIKQRIPKEEQKKYIELFQNFGAKRGWF